MRKSKGVVLSETNDVKTVRFANVVATSGEPEAHLVLMEPSKDRELQAAIKSHRLMTVFQDAVGGKADHGIVGFEPGRGRQFLVFPKSLREFAGKNVVGIKYDLLSAREVPKSQRAPAPREPKKPAPKIAMKAAPKTVPSVQTVPTAPKTRARTVAKSPRPVHVPPPALEKVVPFKPAPHVHEEENEEVAELKRQVRHAMDVLEQGKQVAAFNLLKRIVEG